MVRTIRRVPSSPSPTATHHLIFFVTGNPGLISYYDSYLSTLHGLLDAQAGGDKAWHIYGQSMLNFEDDDADDDEKEEKDGAQIRTHPLSLDEQIASIYASLLQQRIPSGPRQGTAYDSVLLIGHSVGTYMILEMLQRRLSNPRSTAATARPNIRAAILLFPTVTHIAHSPSGAKFVALFRIPELPRLAAVLARGLVWVVPAAALKWAIGRATGMPEDGAEVTTRFLQSRMGVWQAL